MTVGVATTLASIGQSNTEQVLEEDSQTSESAPSEEMGFKSKIAEGGWIIPEPGVNLGSRLNRSELVSFPEANDGPQGVTITKAFLDTHKDAAWLSSEGGVPVISGIVVEDRCLNIATELILRDSYINCPTRIQNDSWGYAGEVNDTPAVNVLAENVVIEYNTITCSGFDENICGRNIRLGGRGAIVQYNDLSFARGAVQLFHNSLVQYNYMHSFSYGLDPNRKGNTAGSNGVADEITHNNAVNNQGYENTIVVGNYIDASYGRVSQQPTRYLNPHFRAFAYEGGVVEVGDPINGFTFSNYLSDTRTGTGYVARDNYILNSGRPFRCNGSSKASNMTCAEDFSNNAFAQDKFDLFKVDPLFEDPDGKGFFAGECNYLLSANDEPAYLAEDIFGPRFTHKNTGC